jgi:putative transposase
LGRATIKMTVSARGGSAAIWREEEHERDIFSTPIAPDLHRRRVHAALSPTRIRQSMGRVGSWFDNAAAEAFFSSLEWEVPPCHHFADTRQAQVVVRLPWSPLGS